MLIALKLRSVHFYVHKSTARITRRLPAATVAATAYDMSTSLRPILDAEVAPCRPATDVHFRAPATDAGNHAQIYRDAA